MTFDELNRRLAEFVRNFMRMEVAGVVIVAGLSLVALTFIPVLGQLIGIIVLAALVYYLYIRWFRTF